MIRIVRYSNAKVYLGPLKMRIPMKSRRILSSFLGVDDTSDEEKGLWARP